MNLRHNMKIILDLIKPSTKLALKAFKCSRRSENTTCIKNSKMPFNLELL